MVIADFFHYENIAERVVKSSRFNSMLKEAQLVGGEFRPQTRRNIGGKNYYCLVVNIFYISHFRVNC